MSLQQQIDSLMADAGRLLPSADNAGITYADTLAELNSRIHSKLTYLYTCHGATPEQEASRCLALLMGYSVTMYANPDDERKKQHILNHSQQLIEALSPSQVKEQLASFYHLLTADDIHTPTNSQLNNPQTLNLQTK